MRSFGYCFQLLLLLALLHLEYQQHGCLTGEHHSVSIEIYDKIHHTCLEQRWTKESEQWKNMDAVYAVKSACPILK